MSNSEYFYHSATAKSLQSCPTLCNPVDGSPPGSPVPAILQARTLEWAAISSSNAWKWNVKVKSLSLVRLLATPRTAAHQAPPSMGFSRQEYWSGVPWGHKNTILRTSNIIKRNTPLPQGNHGSLSGLIPFGFEGQAVCPVTGILRQEVDAPLPTPSKGELEIHSPWTETPKYY